ncbi:hypothetical protein [Archaeoglobus sp.]
MKVYKIKMGCVPDSSGGFGFILMYPLACILAAILASGYIYAAVQLGVLDDEEADEEHEESKD